MNEKTAIEEDIIVKIGLVIIPLKNMQITSGIILRINIIN